MKTLHTILGRTALLGVTLAAAWSCSDNVDPVVDGGQTDAKSKYFIAATAGTGTYLLTADSLESGKTTVVGNGVELPRTYTMWVPNGTKAAVGLIYAQGDPGIGVSYGLNTSGQLAPVGNEFQITSRFTSYGAFDKYVITSVSGVSLTTGKTGAVFNLIDLNNGNTMTQKEVVTENLTGNGGIATFSGIADFGNGEFLTGAVVSAPRAGTASGGSSSGTVTYPDSVWIAAFDANLNLKRIYRDNRISYSSGRFRSQYYSQIAADGSGNVYVFSGSFEGSTTKPAGALLIKKGATAFDRDYYFNIQEKSGGYRFRRVWNITDDYFLLEFYNDLSYTSLSPATQYGIVKMSDKSFKWLSSGFPAKDQITAIGIPFSDKGKLYFPITAANASPTIYVIDPVTGTAKAGLVVEADGIGAAMKMTY